MGIASLCCMLQVDKSEKNIAFQIYSETSLVDKILKETERFVDRDRAENHSGLMIVLRELLLNALIHGNNNVAERHIKCRIEKLEKARLRVEVEDEGSGFDYQNLDMRLPENPCLLERRGYILINALSDSIEFNSRGNCITAYVTLNQEGFWRGKSPQP
ncbi:MAG TPA: ATP-binding protein [Spirochaetales bacterium]|nr:ATP-binding protein [Spirochaetales bacterium]